jgi:hypothetical protein
MASLIEISLELHMTIIFIRYIIFLVINNSSQMVKMVSDEKAVIFFDDSGKSETALGPMAIAGPL